MANAKTAGCAGKPSIGHKRDFGSHALAVKRRRCRQHFAHAGSAAGSFIADNKNATFLIIAFRYGLEAVFFIIEAERGSTESQCRFRHARDLHDRPLWREASL